MSVSESMNNLKSIVELARENSMKIRAGLQCVWGYDGNNDYDQLIVIEHLRKIVGMGVNRISLVILQGWQIQKEF